MQADFKRRAVFAWARGEQVDCGEFEPVFWRGIEGVAA